jgi:hypothetical protein
MELRQRHPETALAWIKGWDSGLSLRTSFTQGLEHALFRPRYWESMMQNIPCMLTSTVDVGTSTSRTPLCGQQEVTVDAVLTQRTPCLCFMLLDTEMWRRQSTPAPLCAQSVEIVKTTTQPTLSSRFHFCRMTWQAKLPLAAHAEHGGLESCRTSDTRGALLAITHTTISSRVYTKKISWWL